MLTYIKGELTGITEDGIIIENQGIGYHIMVPATVMNQLPPSGSDLKIYTYLYVREDAMKLYGFMSREDLNIFKLLITVNGIGPKGALGILSAITPDDLRFAVLAGDTKAISKAPGIGVKTAGKLILELKDKLSLEDAFEDRLAKHSENVVGASTNGMMGEAIEALTALGYSGTEAARAVRKVPMTEDMTVEDLLKQSLKYME